MVDHVLWPNGLWFNEYVQIYTLSNPNTNYAIMTSQIWKLKGWLKILQNQYFKIGIWHLLGEKINLCLRQYILKGYCFAVKVTFKGYLWNNLFLEYERNWFLLCQNSLFFFLLTLILIFVFARSLVWFSFYYDFLLL